MTKHVEQYYTVLNDTHSLYKFKINHFINIFLNLVCVYSHYTTHSSVLSFMTPDLSVWVVRSFIYFF